MSEKVQVTVEVAKELSELLAGVVQLVVTLKPVLKDGMQAADVGALVAAALGFMPALKGVEQLPAEVTLEPGECAMAGAVFVANIVKALRG